MLAIALSHEREVLCIVPTSESVLEDYEGGTPGMVVPGALGTMVGPPDLVCNTLSADAVVKS